MNEFGGQVHRGGITHQRQYLFEMVSVVQRSGFGGGKKTVGSLDVHLARSDGTARATTDEKVRGQFVANVMFVSELNNIAFGGMFFVVDFAPIDDGEGVIFTGEFLLGKVPQRRN